MFAAVSLVLINRDFLRRAAQVQSPFNVQIFQSDLQVVMDNLFPASRAQRGINQDHQLSHCVMCCGYEHRMPSENWSCYENGAKESYEKYPTKCPLHDVTCSEFQKIIKYNYANLAMTQDQIILLRELPTKETGRSMASVSSFPPDGASKSVLKWHVQSKPRVPIIQPSDGNSQTTRGQTEHKTRNKDLQPWLKMPRESCM